MKALVMGGTEFVGRALAKHLIDTGYIVDIFTRGIKEVKYGGFRRHLKGDRKSNEESRMNISNEKYDYVFDISAYTREDVEGVVAVLNRENLKRYVFCSSGAVYIPSEEIVNEEFTRGENYNWGAYGLNKKRAEDYLFNLHEKEGFPVTMFRPTYIYGEGNNLYRECYLFDRITKGLDIPIPAGGRRTQFIYIDDLVRVYESSVHCDKAIGQAYNVTHPQIVNWEQLVNTAMMAVDRSVDIKKIDSEGMKIAAREYFPFRDVAYMLDTKKSEGHGLYQPRLDLLEGMKRAYKWYSEMKPELRDIRMNKIDFALEKASK